MSIISDTSEYIGIRIAMHDALQRYYAGIQSYEPIYGAEIADDEKIGFLRGRIREACRENHLLGRRNFAVAEAWAHFIDSREPAQIVAFLADPEVIRYSTESAPLKDKVATMGFADALPLLVKSRNFAFEQIAQRVGLIDYAAGETLSKHLKAAELDRTGGKIVEPWPAETPEKAAAIRQAFDTPFGNVDPADMGLPPTSRADALRDGKNDTSRGR